VENYNFSWNLYIFAGNIIFIIMKRRIISHNECAQDLSLELPVLFNTFKIAVKMFEEEIILTPPESRGRGLEAALLNSKMIQSVQKNFPGNWKFGKYKRFILRVKGYNVLFKKLDRKNRPMNIKTRFSESIANQKQFELFDDSFGIVEPIIFFGYKKDRFGVIGDMKLVYIDENSVGWTVTEDRIYKRKTIEISDMNKKEIREIASPRVKIAKRIAQNE
jgi:hypothetical protein